VEDDVTRESSEGGQPREEGKFVLVQAATANSTWSNLMEKQSSSKQFDSELGTRRNNKQP